MGGAGPRRGLGLASTPVNPRRGRRGRGAEGSGPVAWCAWDGSCAWLGRGGRVGCCGPLRGKGGRRDGRCVWRGDLRGWRVFCAPSGAVSFLAAHSVLSTDSSEVCASEILIASDHSKARESGLGRSAVTGLAWREMAKSVKRCSRKNRGQVWRRWEPACARGSVLGKGVLCCVGCHKSACPPPSFM